MMYSIAPSVAVLTAIRRPTYAGSALNNQRRHPREEPKSDPKQRACKGCSTKFNTIHAHCPSCGTAH